METENILKDNSLLKFIQETVGEVDFSMKPISLHSTKAVYAHQASIRNEENHKILFTTGLFAYGMQEYIFCIPKSWKIINYYFNKPLLDFGNTDAPYLPDTFPIDVLRYITASIVRTNSKLNLTDGITISRNKNRWNKLYWPEKTTGLVVLDYQWNSTETTTKKEDNITFYTLLPIFEGQKVTPDWLGKYRFAKWADVALPIDRKIELKSEMNKAVENADIERMCELADLGADVNAPFIEQHPVWGVISSDNLVGRLLYKKDLQAALILIKYGAKLPKAALASSVGWCTKEDIDKLLSLGCDINTIDNVGWTALDRAESLKRMEIVEYIRSLGGINAKE